MSSDSRVAKPPTAPSLYDYPASDGKPMGEGRLRKTGTERLREDDQKPSR